MVDAKRFGRVDRDSCAVSERPQSSSMRSEMTERGLSQQLRPSRYADASDAFLLA